VIVALPAASAVTRPLLETVATFVLLLDHVTIMPVSTFPLVSFTVVLSCAVAPCVNDTDEGAMATLAADMAETGNRNLEGDALAGALLAEAAARSAATLAQLNISLLSRHALSDAPLERVRPELAKATRARERAVGAYARLERL